ncbi:hypothetical protein VOLCADRAFT_96064 [Volvox carteri f. nagariensis]|uniref:Uncharacterized protein n=1 Tax=Volvox carteri f. nagariensis TaxID=3068 RepID=D8U941_VOLCA|nr:uncharacterized protein VOLCADRAFT_96064 [Volvox carteri f. nagariensis]EFJ43684.1 hypothetical protein VOLCADRAFT_96064 [Volvox carteri f. nagariensis]|eukprot:XP_002955165.1 hypothetical protein VOLCADRAFT_96064 [Volvox carteri f. nagariensis]
MLRRAAGAFLFSISPAFAAAPCQRLPGVFAAGLTTSGAAAADSTTDKIKETVSRVAEKIHDATERAKESLKGAADSASHTMGEYKDRAREGVDNTKAAASDMKEQAKQRMSQYGEGAREGLREARDSASEAVHSAGEQAKESLRGARDSLRGTAEAAGERIRTTTAEGQQQQGVSGVDEQSDVLGSTTPTAEGGSRGDEAARAAGRVVGETASAFRSGQEEGERRNGGGSGR